VNDQIRTDTAAGAQSCDAYFTRFYSELRASARRFMGGERGDHTLQPTALVNEAFMRLIATPDLVIHDQSHFMRLAARAMRNVLVDHARRHDSKRRGGDRIRVTLTDGKYVGEPEFDLFDLVRGVERLAALDERQASIIEMRFLLGLSVEEVAVALGVSPRTVKSETRFALAWLRNELE